MIMPVTTARLYALLLASSSPRSDTIIMMPTAQHARCLSESSARKPHRYIRLDDSAVAVQW